MPDRKKILIDGIKKLLALKVPDEEIILNLKELNISKSSAEALIEEAKHPKEEPEEKPDYENKEPPKEVLYEEGIMGTEEEPNLDEEAEELSDETLGETQEEEEALSKEESGEEKKPSRTEKAVAKILSRHKKRSGSESDDFAKVWEKGILTMVSQKLEEMKKIQENIEEALQKRASVIAKKEVEKINVLFESQRTLTLEKVDARLEQKTEQLEQSLDSKISEMKEISKSIKSDIARLEKLHAEQKDGLKLISERLDSLKEMEKKLIAEMNSELIKSKSNVEEFLDSAEKKAQGIDDRISKTLELESSIVDSLVKNAEERIAKADAGTGTEHSRKAEEELEELKTERLAFEQSVREKIALLDKKIAEIKKAKKK